MTRIEAAWLKDPAAQAVCAALGAGGHQAYFVGGCVRNTLLGVPVTDLDIATNARPDQVMDLMRAAGLRVAVTGLEHGTLTVVHGNGLIEVTTFRRDVATDGRRAVVAFADTLEEDAHRRDFTMNALYADPQGVVHDPVNGLPDLKARHFRFIDDPDQRIREDYLRILRFFRFNAWYGDPTQGPDPDGLVACAANSAGIETLSRERVRSEMLKLLEAPDPGSALASMAQAGVLAQVLPGADPRLLPVLIHLEDGLPADPLRRLALIAPDDVHDVLRLSRAHALQVRRLREAAAGSAPAAELGYHLGAKPGRDALLIRAAWFEQPLPEGWPADLERGARSRFPVSANDLMPDVQGPALGARLKALEAAWIASDFVLGREDLLALPAGGD